MAKFNYTYPMAVRYADLDAQGHMNHAKYFTFMEQARFQYWMAVGLWDATRSFDDVGQIVAEAACTYKRPILIGQTVDVAVRTARLGRSSLDMEYRLTVGEAEAATGRTVQVAYDYAALRSIPIPNAWRAKIKAFEIGNDL